MVFSSARPPRSPTPRAWPCRSTSRAPLLPPAIRERSATVLPTALGAKVANPDKQVISVTGDGGFLFGASELATAVQHRIATVTLIFNNNAYGNVKREQVEKYGGRVIATDLHNPDFVKLAEAYGAQGLRVETPEALGPAIRRGFDHDGPTLIEIPVADDLPSPWDLIDMPRVRKAKH